MGRKRKAEPQRTKIDRHGIRDRLLRAAETRFAERGLHRSQVSEVAREAGVSVGAFYRYFRDKEELYRELLSERFGAFLDEMRALLGPVQAMSVAQRVELLRSVFRRSFEIHLADPESFLLWYRYEPAVNDEMDALIVGFRTELEALVADVLERTLTVGGTLDAEQRQALAMAMLGMTNAVAHQMIVRGTPTLEVAVDLCTRFAIAGLIGFAPRDLRTLLLSHSDVVPLRD